MVSKSNLVSPAYLPCSLSHKLRVAHALGSLFLDLRTATRDNKTSPKCKGNTSLESMVAFSFFLRYTVAITAQVR